MSVFLQEESEFSLLGQCVAHPNGNGQLLKVRKGNENKSRKKQNAKMQNRQGMYRDRNEDWNCGCERECGLIGQHRRTAGESNHWIRMLCDSCEIYGGDIHWIPKLHHAHWNGKMLSQCDVHVCKS